MVIRQPHHDHGEHGAGASDEAANDENRTSPEGSCGDVAAYVLGVLEPDQHVIFSRHLAGCESCQRDAADFGMFAPVLREVVGQPAGRHPCRITRSILVVAAGVVVAVAAVLSVVESLSTRPADPVEVGTLTRAVSAHAEQFPLFRHV
ncbi:zf-HC2 domain-containing protein [Lentzea terrae]|uniref:zf-HC2 domain-containing protein n=1 Tax=Lentzea terrae TaxID=2200761 RepID=UPI000DD3750F|nr:zf-HC2 domain-containing protein [Lentzea terrae]